VSPAVAGWLRAVTAIGCALLAAQAANASDRLCRGGTDDTLRTIPDALVPTATRLFHLDAMPSEQIKRSTYFRCQARRVLLCTVGANLPCGKGNASRHLPAADEWCAANPGASFIPMYVTGHDTLYNWRCSGKRAAIVGQPLRLDRRGFIANLWKPADAAARP
jgi:hypothetical protein